VAVVQLREIRGDLLCTRVIALKLGLSDTHAARARHLVKKIAAALTIVGQRIEREAR
jgi:ribosomal protein L29